MSSASDNNKTASDFMASIGDEQTIADAETLKKLMQRISGYDSRLWNEGTFGFDTYHYKYASGREGDSFIIGFYPRKNKITVYLMDGTARYKKLLATLGTHTASGYCVYIKRLEDISLPVLETILQQSYDFIKSLSKEGPIDHILWQTEK